MLLILHRTAIGYADVFGIFSAAVIYLIISGLVPLFREIVSAIIQIAKLVMRTGVRSL